MLILAQLETANRCEKAPINLKQQMEINSVFLFFHFACELRISSRVEDIVCAENDRKHLRLVSENVLFG